VSETLIDKIRQTAKAIPPEVKHFVLKGTVLLVGWCLLYGLILKPYDLIDPALTQFTGKATVWLIRCIYQEQHPDAIYTARSVVIFLQNKQVLSIWDPCNGLDLYVLFTGFILCVPMRINKMIMYILIGVISIFVLNVLRCVSLASLFYHHFGYTDIAHHYFFQLIVYAAIFFIWERYFRSLKNRYEISEV